MSQASHAIAVLDQLTFCSQKPQGNIFALANLDLGLGFAVGSAISIRNNVYFWVKSIRSVIKLLIHVPGPMKYFFFFLQDKNLGKTVKGLSVVIRSLDKSLKVIKKYFQLKICYKN